jgi:hypothetical protein
VVRGKGVELHESRMQKLLVNKFFFNCDCTIGKIATDTGLNHRNAGLGRNSFNARLIINGQIDK